MVRHCSRGYWAERVLMGSIFPNTHICPCGRFFSSTPIRDEIKILEMLGSIPSRSCDVEKGVAVGWAWHTLLAEAVQQHHVFAQAKAVFSGSLGGHDGDKEVVRELSLGLPKL